MADILTDPSATFAATTVLATKLNNTPRLDSDSSQYVIAQWGNEVDAALKALSEWLQGDAGAGTAGNVLQYLGSIGIAEDLFVFGSTIEAGNDALAGATISLRGSNTSTLNFYFSDAALQSAAGFRYDHSVDQMDILAANASRFQLTSGVFRATNHNVVDLGDSTHRWREAYVNDLFAVTSAKIGTGADVTLIIDGSSSSGSEPKIDLHHGGALAGRVTAAVDGDGAILQLLASSKIEMIGDAAVMPRSSTAVRLAITEVQGGMFSHDTDTNSMWYHNGMEWRELSRMPSISMSAANGTVAIANGATEGEAGIGMPVFFFGAAADTYADWFVEIPSTYRGGNLSFKLYWAGSSAVAGNSIWQIGFHRLTAAEDLTVDQRVLTGFTLAAPAAIFATQIMTMNLTNVNMDGMQPGDTMRVTLMRDADAGTDTYAGTVGIMALQLSQA